MNSRALMVAVSLLVSVSLLAARERPTRTPPKKPAMSGAQQQNVSELANDLAAIKNGSSVTQTQKNALADDLMALVDGATKPDEKLVDELVDDLYAALEDQQISTAEAVKLAGDIEDVMNSANIPKSEVDQAIADAKAILLASGVTKSDVQEIVSDLQAIAKELQSSAGSMKVQPQSGSQARPKRGRP